MLRILLCLFLAFLSPATGSFIQAVAGEVCVDGCPDDDEQGQCAPECDDCTCCAQVRAFAVAAPAVDEPQRPDAQPIEYEEAWPPSADVGDILHVPIAPFA